MTTMWSIWESCCLGPGPPAELAGTDRATNAMTAAIEMSRRRNMSTSRLAGGFLETDGGYPRPWNRSQTHAPRTTRIGPPGTYRAWNPAVPGAPPAVPSAAAWRETGPSLPGYVG